MREISLASTIKNSERRLILVPLTIFALKLFYHGVKKLVMLTFNLLLFTKCCRLLTRASGFSHYADILPAGNYMFKVNNRNTRRRSEIFSKLTIKTPERRHRHQNDVITCFYCWLWAGECRLGSIFFEQFLTIQSTTATEGVW